MPTTRKTKSSQAPPGPGRQAKLTFAARVSKNKSGSQSGKKDSPPSSAPVKPQPIEPAEPEEATPEPVAAAVKTEAEVRAEQLSDAAIATYWRELERQQGTKRVHQAGLSLNEKVLRYFDVSSKYGPCVGMPRLQRWQRAERFGLHPPIEVLAALQREEAEGSKGYERAHMDEILGSIAVGSQGSQASQTS